MVDTVITLGTFEFRDLEVPESINFGGDQRLAVHEMIGNNRDVQTLGAQPSDITWSGLMTNGDALSRAQALNNLRITGNPLEFSVFNEKYSVIISNFTYNVERYYQVRYTITLKVVVDYVAANNTNNVVGFDDQIAIDFTNVTNLANIFNDPELNNLLGLTSATIRTTNFTTASPNTISVAVSQIDDAQDQVEDLTDEASQNIGIS